ncbi:hypothetical protein PAMP_004495 [Pampus punctatissimus]
MGVDELREAWREGMADMDAAPGLLSPLTPHRCPKLSQSAVTKQWKIGNTPEPTCQYAGQLGAFERQFWLRIGARCCVKHAVITEEMKEGKRPCGAFL